MAQAGTGAHPGDALTSEALAQIREILRVPRRGRGGKMETPEGARRRGAVDLPIIGVLAGEGLRRAAGSRPHLGRRRVLARRHRPDHDPQGQEPNRACNGGSDRGHCPGCDGDQTVRPNRYNSGVRNDGRNPGQSGPRRRARRRTG